MKESSRFYSSLGLLIFLNVIVKPAWIFGIDRQVQNIVGTEAYGTYFSLLGFSIVLSFMMDWGLTPYFTRQLAAHPEKWMNRVGYFLQLKLLLIVAYAAIVSIVAWLSGVTAFKLLFLLIGIQALTSLFLFLRGMITALQWFKTDAWLSVIDKMLMIIFCSILIYAPSVAGGIDLYNFLWIQLGCTGLAIGLALIILKRKGVRIFVGSPAPGIKQIFYSAFPFAMIVLLMSIHYRLDGFLLERIHENGPYEAGIYARAYRLLDAANMIGYLLASFLLPYIARQWKLGRGINSVVLNSRHILILFSIWISITVFALAPWIDQLLYPGKNGSASTILQWCLPVLVAYSLVQVYGTVLTATGHLGLFCRITLIAVLINIVLNIYLVPGWGAQGCCIAALVSQGFCAICTMVYAGKKTGTSTDLPSVLMYIFIVALLVAYFRLTSGSPLGNWVVIAGAGLLTLLAAVTGKLVDAGKWKRLFKQADT